MKLIRRRETSPESKGIHIKRNDGAKTPPHTPPAKVMTLRELSAYLRVHPTTVYLSLS